MSRYIDADKLFLHFNDWALAVSPDERDSDVPEYSEYKIHEMIYRTINEAMSAIEQQPTANMIERKHGEWTEEGYCPFCKCDMPAFIEDWEWKRCQTPYCPNCGADMRGERKILPKD